MTKGLKIALQLYSVRDDVENELKGTLEKVKDMGYEGVEFAGLYGHSPEQVRKWLDEIGLVPVSAHVSIDELNADLAGTINTYKIIGCKFIAIPWLDQPRRPGNPGFNQVKKDITLIAAECKKQGITLLYHNHDFEFIKIDGEYALDILYKEIPDLQTQIDTCWVNVGGEDPAAYIRKYTGRAPVVHLKDFAGRKSENMFALIGMNESKSKTASGDFEYRPLGNGLQNVPSLLSAAADAGAGWAVVEMDSPGMGLTAMECAKKSMDYLLNL